MVVDWRGLHRLGAGGQESNGGDDSTIQAQRF